MESHSETVGGIPREAGRSAFGGDPALYDSARPPYPAELFETFDALHPIAGANVFEIGPGTGIATKPILALHPARHVAVEPDARLGAWLAQTCSGANPEPEIVTASWEEADLAPAAFDVGLAATSFHWLDESPALAKVAATLRAGGLWAMWWNVYTDPERPDPLYAASRALYREIADTPSRSSGQDQLFLNEGERLTALREAGLARVGSRRFRWTIRMDAAQVRALAATYSGIALATPDARARLLDRLEDLVETTFGGAVERPFMTMLYWGYKPG